MVDVSTKDATRRSAHASCAVVTNAGSSSFVTSDGTDIIHAARLAGILAAKQTAALIPLCHPLNLDDIQVDVTKSATGLDVESTVVATQHTGVEMEALTACAVTALSLVTSLLEHDRGARMDDLVLLRKTGGRSGDWGRSVAEPH